MHMIIHVFFTMLKLQSNREKIHLGLFDLSVFHPVSAIDQSYYSGDSLGKDNIPAEVI